MSQPSPLPVTTGETPSVVAPFDCEGVTFRCYAAAERYVWRTDCGRAAVGRDGALCWATLDGVELGRKYVALIVAMTAAARALSRSGASDAHASHALGASAPGRAVA